MWRISLNGYDLDVSSAFAPSFQRTNNVFNFGSLNLTRTVSFDLPDTPTNNAAFGFASDYHNNGAGARVYHDAVLQGDSVSFTGSLYIEKTEKGKYSAAFSCGEYEALRALSEAGDITFANAGVDAQMYPLTQGVSSALTVGVAANNLISSNYTFVVRHYDNLTQAQNTKYYNPSIRLSDLFANVQSRYGVSVHFPTGYEDLAVVVDKLNAPTSYDVTLAKSGINAASVSSNLFISVSTIDTEIFWHALTQQQRADFKFFVSSQDITLTFPANFPSNVFCCDGEEVPTFFGGYLFDTSLNGDTSRRSGRPLAGRTIEIAANQKFGFFLSDNYVNTRISTTNYTRGFLSGTDASAYNYNIKYSEQSEINPTKSHNYFLRDNYPKLKYIDALRLYALVSGQYMQVSGNVVTYSPYNVDAWRIVEPQRVKNTSTIKRVFADFEQSGFIAFDSAEQVVYPERVDYRVNNATLAQEKQIAKIAFSEGDASKTNDDNVFIYDFYTDEDNKVVNEAKKQTLTRIGSGSRLNRVYLPTVEALQRLCDTSTQVEAEIVLSAYEFFNIAEETRLYINGSLFVWLSASWSKNLAKFVLQKLS